MTDTHLGLIVTAVPALIIGLVLLGRYKPVLWMYIGAMAIGLGYLTVQGTVEDIGRETRTYLPAETLSEPTVAPEPSPAVAPEPAPAPEPEPAPAPAPEAVPSPSPAPTPESPAEAPEPEPATP